MSLQTKFDNYHTIYNKVHNSFIKIFIISANKLENRSIKDFTLLLAKMYVIAKDIKNLTDDEKIFLFLTKIAQVRKTSLSKFFIEYEDKFAKPIDYVDYKAASQLKRHLLTTNLTITKPFKSIKDLIEQHYMLQYNKVTPKTKILIVESIAFPEWLEEYIEERFGATYFYLWPEK